MKPSLDLIVRRTREDLVERRRRQPEGDVRAAAERRDPPMDFKAAVARAGEVSLIAELKAASPSAGVLRDPYDVAAGARAYARGGARALSVLTEPHYFKGALADLSTAKAASGLPVLRKDFVVDVYQITEARAAGADAVLLIVRILTDEELAAFLREARAWGLAALVEVHSAEEMSRAAAVGADLIGVNSRNLDTLTMDPDAFAKFIPRAPRGAVLVAESGIKTPAELRALWPLGVSAALVGESLLRQKDLEVAARALAEAGRFP